MQEEKFTGLVQQCLDYIAAGKPDEAGRLMGKNPEVLGEVIQYYQKLQEQAQLIIKIAREKRRAYEESRGGAFLPLSPRGKIGFPVGAQVHSPYARYVGEFEPLQSGDKSK